MKLVEPIRDKEKIETVKRILKENGIRDYLCLFNHSASSITLRYIGINQDIIDSSLRSFAL